MNKDEVIRFRASKELKDFLQDYCNKTGLDMSTALRQLVVEQLLDWGYEFKGKWTEGKPNKEPMATKGATKRSALEAANPAIGFNRPRSAKKAKRRG